MQAEERRLIVFVVADFECAIDVERVEEVLPFRAAPADFPVPIAADGVAVGRESALPYVDLRSRLDLPPGEPRDRRRVLRLRDASIGVLVDDVLEVLDVPADRIGPTPALLRRHGMAHVEAVVRLEDGRLLLLLRFDTLAPAAPPHAEGSAPR